MKVESTPPPQPTAKTPTDVEPIHVIPKELGSPSTNHPQAAEVVGHLLGLPHDVPSEALQKTLLLSFLAAIGKKS
jgi:hypothetical protein